ncbi:hypothetical protein V8C42DRAFT_286504 [Trichoderma barbatum]
MASRRTSAACVNCRSRRIKCNESKPRCAQCARAGLFCWGYRNQMELRIVDMTGTQDRKKGKQHNLSNSNTTPSETSSWSKESHRQQNELVLPLPRFNFSIPPESVAQVFFFRHFSIAGASRLYAEQGTAPLPTMKMLGISAVGMAGVANSERDHGLMALARRKYGSTLHSINDAIGEREEVTKESTVAAVILMAMFEFVACQDCSSLEAWVCHIQGAAILLRHWSEDDWKKAISMRVFLHFFYLLAMGCLIRRIPVPTHMQQLAHSSSSFKPDANFLPAKQLFGIVCRFTELHALENTDKVTQITERVSTAMSIEDELLSWALNLPQTWKYVDLDKTNDGSRHVYACSLQAQIWNQYRVCRVLVHTVLLRNLDALALPVTQAHPALAAAYTSHREASREIVATMMLDIRDSVSYILGLYDSTTTPSSEHSRVFGLLGSIQALIGIADIGGKDADWLCQMLELVGSRWGIGLALVLGRHLRARS